MVVGVHDGARRAGADLAPPRRARRGCASPWTSCRRARPCRRRRRRRRSCSPSSRRRAARRRTYPAASSSTYGAPSSQRHGTSEPQEPQHNKGSGHHQGLSLACARSAFRGRRPGWWTCAVTDRRTRVRARPRGSAIRLAAAARARLAGRGRAGRDGPVPPGLPGDRRRPRRDAQRCAAHAHLVPGRAGVRPAGDGAAVGPLRAPRPAARQRRGLRRRPGWSARPHRTWRCWSSPARAGLRRRGRHGHRPGDHRRRRHRPCGGQGLHPDDHRRRRGAGARPARRGRARRPGRVARHALDRRRAVRRDARRRAAGRSRDAPGRRTPGSRGRRSATASGPCCAPRIPRAARRCSRCASA